MRIAFILLFIFYASCANGQAYRAVTGNKVNTTGPRVTITGTAPSGAAPFTVTFTWTKAVTGFVSTDVFVLNATIGSLSTSDNVVFTATVTPEYVNSTFISVAVAVCTDASGNPNFESSTTIIGSQSPWWLEGGISTSTTYTIYDPMAASSQSNSYVNLANAGVRDALPTGSFSWSQTLGWDFNGSSQYVDTQVKASPTTTAIIMYEDAATNDGVTIGVNTTSPLRSFTTRPNESIQSSFNIGQSNFNHAPAQFAGIVTLLGTGAYSNGVSENVTPTWTGGAMANNIYVGATDDISSPNLYFSGRILRVAIYDFLLSAAQIRAVTDAIQTPLLSNLTEYSYRVLALAPMMYWPCNGVAGYNGFLKDYSGNRYFGYNRGDTQGNSGKYGPSLFNLFVNGNSHLIYCAQGLSTAINMDEFSLSFWIKTSPTLEDQKLMELWNTGLTEYSAYEIRGGTAYDVFLTETGVQQSFTGPNISTNVWHQVICFNSKSGGKVGYYIDGTLYETTRTVPGLTNKVVANNYPQLLSINGYVQNIAWFDHKLSQSEVNQISY